MRGSVRAAWSRLAPAQTTRPSPLCLLTSRANVVFCFCFASKRIGRVHNIKNLFYRSYCRAIYAKFSMVYLGFASAQVLCVCD